MSHDTYHLTIHSRLKPFQLHGAFLIYTQAAAPRPRTLQFDFVKDWMTRYAACAININSVNSTGLGHGLPCGLQPALVAAS